MAAAKQAKKATAAAVTAKAPARAAGGEGKKARALGRGLAALFGETPAEPAAAAAPAAAPAAPGGGPRQIPIEHLHPNLDQPRRHFEEAALEALAASLREQGVLQPLMVRPHPEKQGEYQIVAGERRWRAAQRAQLAALPVVVRTLDDRETLEIAIVENVQREDLSPLEEAEAYQRLTSDFGYSQEQIAKAVGKSRSHIANTQRLLALPFTVKEMIAEGRLSAGHGRALLAAPDPVPLAKEAAKAGWSVREMERRAQQAARPSAGRGAGRPGARPSDGGKDADTLALENDLTLAVGMKVEIEHQGGSGRVRLHYNTLEQLDDIIMRLRQTPEH